MLLIDVATGGFSAWLWSVGGEDAAHLAQRRTQAPGNLDGVAVHEKGHDIFPGVALGHPDGGDGGKSCLLGKRETGLNMQLLLWP